MGKIWDILQFVFALLIVWVILDISEGILWVAGFFSGLGIMFLGPWAIVCYLIVIIGIFQMVKAFTRD